MIDVDDLADRALARFRGRVARRALREALAAALTVAINQVVAEASSAFVATSVIERITTIAGKQRPLPVWARAALERELRAAQAALASLRIRTDPPAPRHAPRPRLAL